MIYLPGIYVPLNIKAEATKEAADEVVSDMNVTSYGTDVLSIIPAAHQSRLAAYKLPYM